MSFAKQNGQNGVIITVRNDEMATYFSNCVSFSDFLREYEMLFISGCIPIEISGLYSMEEGEESNQWMNSIKIFQTCFIYGRPCLNK